MPKYYKCIENIDLVNHTYNDKILLTSDELFYLRLFVHDFSDDMISEFLEVDRVKVYQLKYSLKSKFKKKNWRDIIVEAFNTNILNKQDFVDDVVRNTALEKTETVLNKFVIHTYGRSHRKIDFSLFITQAVYDFYSETQSRLRNKYNNICILDIEVNIIKLKYQGYTDTEIYKYINTSKHRLNEYYRSIRKKLHVTNWFNAFKICFYLNILMKSDDNFLNKSNEIENCSKNIMRIKALKRIDLKEKKLMVYNELVRLHTSIEYYYLLNKDNVEVGFSEIKK